MRNTLGSPHIDSRTAARSTATRRARSPARTCRPGVWDIDHAGAVLVLDTELVDESPILDLRVRKAARRHGAQVVVATSRPGSLDPNADATLRFAPGAGEAALAALAAALHERCRDGPTWPTWPPAAGADPEQLRGARPRRSARRGPPSWSSGASASRTATAASRRSTRCSRWREALDLAGIDGSGLIEVPAGANGRGLREVGCAADMRPGPGRRRAPAGRHRDRRALAGDELTALSCWTPTRCATTPTATRGRRARPRHHVIAFADFLNDALDEHANVVFPRRVVREKEGTVTHPDGRVQRLRQADRAPRRGPPAGWCVLDELATPRRGHAAARMPRERDRADLRRRAVLRGLTLEEIGGSGVRWQEREAASKLAAPELPEPAAGDAPRRPPPDGTAARHRAPSLWSGSRVTEHSPPLRFLAPRQRAELSPADAERLGIDAGRRGRGGAERHERRAPPPRCAPACRAGSVFLIEGTTRTTRSAHERQPREVEVARRDARLHRGGRLRRGRLDPDPQVARDLRRRAAAARR